MRVSESPLLRIYTYCSSLISFKRMLFASIQLPTLPTSPLNEEISLGSTKVYVCLKKFMIEMQNQLSQFTRHQKYSEHLPVLQTTIAKLKNNSELLTQEQRLISAAVEVMEEWERTKDPVVYYEVKERVEVRNKLQGILREIQLSYEVNRQAKKPLYIRKLQRELRDNLETMGEHESNYNEYQSNISAVMHKKANKLLSRLFDSLSRMPRHSLVEQQKNELLKSYIDVFNDKGSRVLEKELVAYRRDLAATVSNIQNLFVEERKALGLLLQYLSDSAARIKDVQGNFQRVEERISKEAINIPQDIDAIVSFHEIFDVIGQSKCYFQSAGEFLELKQQLSKLRLILEQSISSTGDFIRVIRGREPGGKVNLIEQFIQDKKAMEGYIKKEKIFETALFEAFIKFLKRIYKRFNQNRPKDSRNAGFSRSRQESKYEKLFDTYFSEVQVYEKSKGERSAVAGSTQPVLKSNNANKIKQIDSFIGSLRIFTQDVESVEAYQCSLGPRLLLHGRMKITAKGIVYESSFNKKNLFFGRTLLFLPKEQIFEINKVTAFFFFPDVIEIVTKKGGVYFHSLGKRQTMYEHLNEMFFPQVNTENVNCGEEVAYHEWKGSQSEMELRVRKYMGRLQYEVVSGEIPNCSARSFFTKYFSSQEFVYQGRSYPDFKYYSVGVVEGTNIKGTDFTPGIPYYMKLVTDPASETENYPESERFFTYGKSVPMIPLVSKGGQGICQQKSVFRWGGPRCFIVEIFTTLSGFSLTEGMMVKSRQVFQQRENVLHYEMSGQVTFETSSAMNGMIRTPALSNLKQFFIKIFEVIKKLERNKKSRGKARINQREEKEEGGTEADLVLELSQVKRRWKWTVVVFVVLYLSTVALLLFR